MRSSWRMDVEYSIEEKTYLVSWAVAYDNYEESARLFREKYDKNHQENLWNSVRTQVLEEQIYWNRNNSERSTKKWAPKIINHWWNERERYAKCQWRPNLIHLENQWGNRHFKLFRLQNTRTCQLPSLQANLWSTFAWRRSWSQAGIHGEDGHDINWWSLLHPEAEVQWRVRIRSVQSAKPTQRSLLGLRKSECAQW